jgi:hypothetical protein
MRREALIARNTMMLNNIIEQQIWIGREEAVDLKLERSQRKKS